MVHIELFLVSIITLAILAIIVRRSNEETSSWLLFVYGCGFLAIFLTTFTVFQEHNSIVFLLVGMTSVAFGAKTASILIQRHAESDEQNF